MARTWRREDRSILINLWNVCAIRRVLDHVGAYDVEPEWITVVWMTGTEDQRLVISDAEHISLVTAMEECLPEERGYSPSPNASIWRCADDTFLIDLEEIQVLNASDVPLPDAVLTAVDVFIKLASHNDVELSLEWDAYLDLARAFETYKSRR